MSTSDRVKDALLALLGMGTPRLDYFTTYRCKVVKQSADLSKVDLLPDDARIPAPSDVPIKWGFPGLKAQILAGSYMNLGWDDGNPKKRYAMLCETGATVTKVVIDASQIYLAGEGGAKRIALEDHTHTFQVNPGPSPAITITTNPPTTGLTTKTKAS